MYSIEFLIPLTKHIFVIELILVYTHSHRLHLIAKIIKSSNKHLYMECNIFIMIAGYNGTRSEIKIKKY